jgi:SAM-dependent methyltransferase
LTDELERLRERYERRARLAVTDRYNPLLPAAYMAAQEKERALIRWIRTCGIEPVTERTVLDVGCGHGGDLIQLIRLGFAARNLVGYELLAERAEAARKRVPAATRIICGDAAAATLEDGSFDVVAQSTVFTSILDDAFQERLAQRMWNLARPGGGILWYDFVYDNPRNPDVRAVKLERVRSLFPVPPSRCWRLTLVPPLSRVVTRLHPRLYDLLSLLPPLRGFLLCWIAKPGVPPPSEQSTVP